MAWEYSEKTKQLFLDAVHGKPGTHLGEIENPDGLGEHGSIACGDAMRFTFRVERDPVDPTRDVIVAARYLTFGCTSAIASSEALCTLIEQGRRTPIEALRIHNTDIVDFLGGLPAQKIHCSVMGAEALEAAVFNWAQILFTSCATESNNTAIFGTAKANPNRRHVITTTVEHPAVIEVCKDLERSGCEVTFLAVDGHGNLDLDEFVRALRPDTLLVSILHANNETGVIFPVPQLSRITKETDPSIVFHTDATQSVGKIPIDLAQEYRHVDLLSFSGHKLHAPKGIGALYVKRATPCRPLLIGGHQEESHASPLHRRSRLRAVQPQPLQYPGGCGPDHRSLSTDRSQLTQALTVLGPAAQPASRRCG
jgi:NifU-like protein involved in Fe-S cluster formation